MNEKGLNQREHLLPKIKIDWSEKWSQYQRILKNESQLIGLSELTEEKGAEITDSLQSSAGPNWKLDVPTAHTRSPKNCDLAFIDDEQLQHSIRELITTNPGQLLQLQAYFEQQLSSIEAHEDALRESLFTAEDLSEENLKQRLGELKKQQEKTRIELITNALATAGIHLGEFDTNQLGKLFETIRRSANEWQNLAYINHLLATAAGILTHVLVTAHELLHSLIGGKLIDMNGTAYHESTKRNHKGILGRVIHEACTLALEYLIQNQSNENEAQDPAWKTIAEFGAGRMRAVREANRLRIPATFAEAAKTLEQPDLQLSDLDTVVYSEGAKLAIALRRNGWKLTDLPELLERIDTTVVTITDYGDSTEWSKIFITKSENGVPTEYEKVIQALRQLKPVT